MSYYPPGTRVYGRITDTDVSTAAALVFKNDDGTTITVGSGERLIIQEIHFNNRATAKVLTVFQDDDGDDALDTGEELWQASFAAAGPAEVQFARGLACRRGNAAGTNNLFAFASAAGNVDVLVIGEIIKS